MVLSLQAHHVGCAVRDLDNARATYSSGLGLSRKTRTFEVAAQGVRVCFLELGRGLYLELIAPLADETRLAPFFETGFYHLCFLVADLSAAREHLASRDFVALPAFASEAFAGASCQFFVTPQSHLIELAQISTPAFEQFFEQSLW